MLPLEVTSKMTNELPFFNYKSVKIDFDFRMRDVSVLIYLLKTSPRPPETKVLRPEKNTFSLTS